MKARTINKLRKKIAQFKNYEVYELGKFTVKTKK